MAQQEATNGAVEEKTVTFTALKLQLTLGPGKAVDALEFYKAAFSAVETGRSLYPKRKAEQERPHILSAQVEVAGSTIIVSDAYDDSLSSAKALGNSVVLILETDDVGAAISKAVEAGAVKDGDITEVEGAGVQGKVKDPYGLTWLLSSPAKDKAEVAA